MLNGRNMFTHFGGCWCRARFAAPVPENALVPDAGRLCEPEPYTRQYPSPSVALDDDGNHDNDEVADVLLFK